MLISKIFIPNLVCVLTNGRYKHIRRDFYSVTWVMPQGWDFGGAQGVKKKFKHGHVAYQNDRDEEQNRMQVILSA